MEDAVARTEAEAKENAERLKAKRNVILTAGVAALGGLLFGYDTGVIASALLFIKPDFQLDNFAQGVVVAAVPVGAVFGAAAAGGLADRYGRRKMILIAAIVFMVGTVACAVAPGEAFLVAGRLLLGVAIGQASATCPVYISEVAPPEYRGRLVTLFQLAVTVGILVAYLVGLALADAEAWRWMLFGGFLPALGLAIGMLYMPRSPRWLVMIGEHDEAQATLRYIRSGTAEEIESELEEIKAGLTFERSGYRELLQPAVRAALVVGVGLAILQQVTGINTVIYYAPRIMEFAGAGSASGAILAAVGVGVVNVAATVLSLYLLNHYGRRTLLIVGVSGMIVTLVALGFAFTLPKSSDALGPLAVISLMAYVASFAISLGPIFWLLNSEIYPLRARTKAAGLGTMANWTFNFVVSLTFLNLIDALGRSGAFWLYAAVGVLTLAFCILKVPETKGRTLEEIEGEFEARAERKGIGPTAPTPPPPPAPAI